jgi:CRP-like cAMP-binding protein
LACRPPPSVGFLTDELEPFVARYGTRMVAQALGNRLFHALTEEEFRRIRPHLQQVTIERGKVLSEVGQPARYVHFPISCVLGLVGTTESGATVVVALVGREGVASVSATLGRQRQPFRVVCQVGGEAWRVPSEAVTAHLMECGDLHERVLQYSLSVIAQVGQSAICNRFHSARQRLARWLLTAADRAQTRELRLTHEFIAQMVGGPRSAVTEAAAALRESGAIDYRRGLLTIRSLAKLRQQACECYEAVQDATRK